LRGRGWICGVGLYGLLLASCADTARDDAEAYVVQPQDTLYSIAWRHNVDFRDLARWNHLGPDFRIVVGQALVMSGAQDPAPAAALNPRREAAGVRGNEPATIPPNGALKCDWPTDRSAVPVVVPGGGILLTGRLGQEVRAACAGKVVYIGSGLRAYGNLIIIKHGEKLLSAYAHNRDSVVREGQEVRRGELIAHMGEGSANGSGQKAVLYFEIRLNGKPADPFAYLPK
jgi:lipoprotein NlpD